MLHFGTALILTLAFCAPASAQQPSPVQNDDPAAEVVRNREQMNQQLAPLLQANPFADGGVAATTGAPPAADQSTALGRVLQFLSHPATQAYLRVFSDPKIQGAAKRLSEHPNRVNLLYSEIALALLLLLFRAWRLGKAKNLWGRLWVGFYTFLLGIVMGTAALPYLWLGDDTVVLGKALFEASQEAISLGMQLKK